MIYKILADIVVIVHFLWILFLIFGVLWGIRNSRVRDVHLFGWVFAIILQAFDWYCPLTYLEIWLRERHDPALSYSGSFIPHYLEKIIYTDLSPGLILVASIFLAGISIVVYVKKGRER